MFSQDVCDVCIQSKLIAFGETESTKRLNNEILLLVLASQM